MASIKIKDLPTVSNVNNSDNIIIDQSSVTGKTTVSDFINKTGLAKTVDLSSNTGATKIGTNSGKNLQESLTQIQSDILTTEQSARDVQTNLNATNQTVTSLQDSVTNAQEDATNAETKATAVKQDLSTFKLDLASSSSGKGASLIGTESGKNLQVTIDAIEDKGDAANAAVQALTEELYSNDGGMGASIIGTTYGHSVQQELESLNTRQEGLLGEVENYLSEDGIGSAIKIKINKTGSIPRTLNNKASEIISLADFGGSPDASAEDLLKAFQASIDALPATGGTIYVAAGDYSKLNTGSLIVPVNKMITWLAHGATLPEGIIGKIETSGYRVQPYENTAGTGGRPGAAYLRMIAKNHVPDPNTGSEQDSILYLEGHSPSVESHLAQEFAALRFNMSSQMYDSAVNPSNLDIKGINGVSVGDTGNAKVRSIRTTSVGINGHYGLVTGIMGAAHRSGVIPSQSPFNGDGTSQWTSGVAGPYLTGDAGIIGQVGPGIQTVFRAEGFAAAERPQYVFLQARGNAAVNPELSVFEVHGGGNGQILRICRSDTDSTIIGRISRLAEAQMSSFSSRTNTVADNSAIVIAPPSTTGFIDIFCGGTSDAWVRAYFRVGQTPVMTATGNTGGSGAVTTGVLSGTTGTDGKFTISAAADGNIYVENRTGASRGVCMHFTCSPQA